VRPLSARLEALKSQQKGPATVDLKARLLRARGFEQRSGRRLSGITRKSRTPTSASPAALLEDVGQERAAEEILREVVAQYQAKQPESVLLLAQFLGRRHRAREALDLCEKAWQHCPPESVGTASVAVLYAANADAASLDRVSVGWKAHWPRNRISPAIAAAVGRPARPAESIRRGRGPLPARPENRAPALPGAEQPGLDPGFSRRKRAARRWASFSAPSTRSDRPPNCLTRGPSLLQSRASTTSR